MISLPEKTGNAAVDVIPDNVRRVVTIGANGAGKTRFTSALESSLADRAFRLNAVDALYAAEAADPQHNAVDRLFLSSPNVVPYEKSRVQSRLERLLAMLMADELANLLKRKFGAQGEEVTRLDTLVAFWREVFPGNHIQAETGRLLFSRDDTDDVYGAVRLSDGERAVLYYGLALLYAPENAVVMVDSPEIFLHPATMQAVWNRLEALRPDCTIVYTTHDLEFAASRREALFIWVRAMDVATGTFDYRIIPEAAGLTSEVTLAIMGARKPVLFIEGDDRSIDARLYPLIFSDCTVKSVGSCNKVIEAVRTFNDLNGFHHLTARGIVDRDRRDEGEIGYLRRKNVMVPDVAEIENLLMLPAVVQAVAGYRGKKADKVLAHVRRSVLAMFHADIRSQALQHTRHRVKRTLEYRIDGRFRDIGALEEHINDLTQEINPRGLYEEFCREFHSYHQNGDYEAVLRVYNQKSMLPTSNVAGLCGLANKEQYIDTVMHILETDAPQAAPLRKALRAALRAD